MDQVVPCYFMLSIFIALLRYGTGDILCEHSCQSSKTCNYMKIQDTCYYIFKDKQRNWFNNRQFCVDQGLSMVKLAKDMIEQTQIYNFSRLFNEFPSDGDGEARHAWLGGRAFDLNNWTFVNNIKVQSLVVPTSRNSNVSVSCGFVGAYNNELNLYYDICAYFAGFICRFDKPGFHIQVIDIQKSWFEARSHCIQLGGDLFYLHKDETLNIAGKYLTDIINSTNPYHIGFRYRLLEWIDGSEILFTNYAPHEPDTFKGNCLLLNSQNGKWYESDCFEDRPTFCQAVPNCSKNQAGFKLSVIILGVLLGVFFIITITLIMFIVCKQRAWKSPKPSNTDAHVYELPVPNHYMNEGVLETDGYETVVE